MRHFLYSFVTVFLISSLTAHAAEPALQTEASVMIELSFTASENYDDPFNAVTLDATFTDPSGRAMRVPAFWAGKNLWKVRYASPTVGAHAYRTQSNHATDTGLHGITGNVEIKPYTGQNPHFARGPLRVSGDKRHLEHADGTPFFWLGDTWWMGLSKRLAWPADVKRLAEDRKKKGFNVIQIVVGPPPDSHPFDPRSVNEAGFPWEENYNAIRPEYFNAADERILYLVEEGFTPCVFGMWGYHMRFMGVDRAKQHWRYLIARYGALPVVWSIAGEANLSWYLAPGFPYHDKEQVTHWTEVTRYVQENDPFNRLVTIHPTGFGWTARDAIDDATLLDFDMLQTPHGQREAVPVTLEVIRRSRAGKPPMPTINGEAAYERLSDSLPTMWTRRMFWLCMTNGAAGHTYGGNGIWQVNRPGDPHGPSPHMPAGVGYGAITWEESMNLPGSAQAAMGKKFFEQFEWHKFQPHPEWAAYTVQPLLSFDASHWIWFPEGNPAQDAPAAKRFFRRTFEIPAGKKIKTARLRVAVDDQFEAKLNGQPVGASEQGAEGWRTGKQFDEIAPLLKAGTNVVSIAGENMPAPSANAAGLVATLEIEFDNSEKLTLASDAEWRSSKKEAAGWDTADFDDASWAEAAVVARFGEGPWGRVEPGNNNPIFGPQATGIAGEVRVIYVPDAAPVELCELEKQATYDASWFDPTTGQTQPMKAITADEHGIATCAPPASIDHDWVLVLRDDQAIRK